LQDPPKFIQIWIFGLKTNHLATLVIGSLFSWTGAMGRETGIFLFIRNGPIVSYDKILGRTTEKSFLGDQI
jgi:hypothetical protein